MCPKEFVIGMVWHMIPKGQRDACQSFIAVPRESMRPFIRGCIGVGADLASLCLRYFAEADVSLPCSSGD